jgi:hypothetical protein
MEFELTGALKKYRRMRGWRSFLVGLAIPLGVAVPWYYDFNRTDTLICLAGAFVFSSIGYLEMRLKTMQIRLAGMADQLDALSGKKSKDHDDNLILELNDW